MHERRRGQQRGDVSGEPHGDYSFPDWDNPEDFDEDAPEGYYDDDDDSYVPDESDPDYDLSEAAGYAGWEPQREALVPRWLIVLVSLILIFAILTPLLVRLS